MHLCQRTVWYDTVHNCLSYWVSWLRSYRFSKIVYHVTQQRAENVSGWKHEKKKTRRTFSCGSGSVEKLDVLLIYRRKEGTQPSPRQFLEWPRLGHCFKTRAKTYTIFPLIFVYCLLKETICSLCTGKVFFYSILSRVQNTGPFQFSAMVRDRDINVRICLSKDPIPS